MGYAKSISTTAAAGVKPDAEGITDYSQKTSNPFAEFMNYASSVAEKAKGGIDENTQGLDSITSTE